MALVGQTSIQDPQSEQVSASITAKLALMVIASQGHCSAQVPQPEHNSALTLTAILNLRVYKTIIEKIKLSTIV